MDFQVTSKHLGDVTELMVLMPLKQGFVDTRRQMSYASRTRILLKVLFALRQNAIEVEHQQSYVGALEKLRTIGNVSWSILNQESSLLMSVTFRGGWEPYIRKIQRQAGPILDAILCSCTDYEAYASIYGYRPFATWVMKHQQSCEFFYSSATATSPDDLQYLKSLEYKLRSENNGDNFDSIAAEHTITTPRLAAEKFRAAHPKIYRHQATRTLAALYGLRDYFPSAAPSQEHYFLQRLAFSLVGDLCDLLDEEKNNQTIHNDYPRPPEHQITWLRQGKLEYPPTTPTAPDIVPKLDDVQADIIKAHRNREGEPMANARLLLLRFEPGENIGNGLRELSQKMTTYNKDDEMAITVSFTYEGIKHLGVPNEQLMKFPKEFRDGMQARAGILGDLRCNHPRNWQHPTLNWQAEQQSSKRLNLDMIDLVISLQTASTTLNNGIFSFDEQITAINNIKGLQVLSVDALARNVEVEKDSRPKVREHFGFVDGISQPHPVIQAGDENNPDAVPLGDLLLGYPNSGGDPVTNNDALFNNGSFLVIRKLEQNVKAFNDAIARKSGHISDSDLKAKMMGRDTEGKPLLHPQNAGIDNHFAFDKDDVGAYCPLQSHIRRSNPRSQIASGEVPIPRIMRRGYSYGSPYDANNDDGNRGLMFMAYNASIAEQFEVIQRWISGGNSSGTHSAQSDPLLGVPRKGETRTFRFKHNDQVVRCTLNTDNDATPLVKLLWGLYLFVPSTTAVNELAKYADTADTRNPVAQPILQRARQTIASLLTLEKFQASHPPNTVNELASTRWRVLLEDLSIRKSGLSEALWQIIRTDYDGALKTSYGLLVASDKLVMKVFGDDDNFSVKEYGQRMGNSLGINYLGMDNNVTQPTKNQYAIESVYPNELIANFCRAEAVTAAFNMADNIINASVKTDSRAPILLTTIVNRVFSSLAKQWFAVVDIDLGDGKIHNPLDDFITTATYCFRPAPSDFVRQEGKAKGRNIKRCSLAYIEHDRFAECRAENPDAIFTKLYDHIMQLDKKPTSEQKTNNKDQLARTLTGLVQGFASPGLGSCLSVINTLIESKQLWHLQETVKKAKNQQISDEDIRTTILDPAIINALRIRPVPGLLHRSSKNTGTLGHCSFTMNETIVLGLESASRETTTASKTAIIFGGDYSSDYSSNQAMQTHPCPGQNMGLGVIEGILCAILNAGQLTRQGPLLLSVNANER